MVERDKISDGGLSQHPVPVPGWDGGNADAAYLDKTLRYTAVETELDESVSGRAVFRIWWRAAVVSVTVYIFVNLIFLVMLVGSADSADSADTFGESSSAGPGTAVLVFGTVLGTFLPFALFWVVLLMIRIPEPIAEWRVLLHDRAGSATSTYSQVSGSLRTRQMPIHYEVKPIDTGSPRDGVRYRLILRENFYVAYVSVFAYGTSLYLGWTMWRTRRGGQLIWQFLTDMVGSMLGRTSPELLILRTERPRAMREAVHAACREGLFVAYEQREVPLQFGFPDPAERSRIPAVPSPAASPFTPAPSAPSQPSQLYTQPFEPLSFGGGQHPDPADETARRQQSPPPPFPPPSNLLSSNLLSSNPPSSQPQQFPPQQFPPQQFQPQQFQPQSYQPQQFQPQQFGTGHPAPVDETLRHQQSPPPPPPFPPPSDPLSSQPLPFQPQPFGAGQPAPTDDVTRYRQSPPPPPPFPPPSSPGPLYEQGQVPSQQPPAAPGSRWPSTDPPAWPPAASGDDPLFGR